MALTLAAAHMKYLKIKCQGIQKLIFNLFDSNMIGGARAKS